MSHTFTHPMNSLLCILIAILFFVQNSHGALSDIKGICEECEYDDETTGYICNYHWEVPGTCFSCSWWTVHNCSNCECDLFSLSGWAAAIGIIVAVCCCIGGCGKLMKI
eukprot:181206_1